MKALPLHQPWAQLVAFGAKRYETRGYPPGRLGLDIGQRIAIHANKTPSELRFCELEHFRDFVPDPDALPLGAVIATCTIGEATKIAEGHRQALLERNPREYAFGNYEPGRWAWRLDDVEQLPAPIPFRGSQGAFDVPDLLIAHGPVQRIDCSYPADHASQHREHPDGGRLVCLTCHPPAALITGAVTAEDLCGGGDGAARV